MNSRNTAYPIRLTSRAGRMRKKRGYLIGAALIAAFGFGCTSALTPVLDGEFSFDVAALMPASVAVDTVDNDSAVVADAIDQQAAELAQLAPAAAAYPRDLDLKVRGGDTFISLLTDVGVSTDEANNVVESIRKVYDPRKLNVGQKLSVQIDREKSGNGEVVVASLSIPTSVTSSLEVTRKANDEFAVQKIDAPVERKVVRGGGVITSSLYETGTKSGIPASLLSELINAYSYDVDFQRDIKHGDTIDTLFERIETKEGVVAGNGNLLYAQLEIGGKTMKIYRYTDKSGNADYFNEKGESVRKALMRTPINGAKITSGFGMRNHPILGYSKMHRGVDFAAPTGTPIYAAGDGTVNFVGQKGGYGNYLQIKHNGTYASAYAHLSRFAKGIKPGSKVKQGQIVAYVGTTGMSTGPHLHYEIVMNGNQVNPGNVKFKTGTVLAGNELKNFKKNVEQLQASLPATPTARASGLAMNETAKKSRVN